MATLAGLFLLTAAIWISSRTLLSANFLPHWYCFVGNKRLLWTTVIADFLIGLSYVAISATLTVCSDSRIRFLIFHSGSRMLHFVN